MVNLENFKYKIKDITDIGEYINVAKIIHKSKANGPGIRCAIWLQGCKRRCKGCYNSELWPFIKKKFYKPDELADLVLKIDGIEGVSLSGGEPLLQFTNLIPFLEKIKSNDLSILCFTGYYLHELPKKMIYELKRLVDILVSGPFIEKKICLNIPLIGSKNQKIYFFSERYCEEDLKKIKKFEIIINENGKIEITGFIEKKFVEEIKNLIFYKKISDHTDNS
ncbi:MAG: 4Fe-4S single cluster domain-containing protein [Candidatus Helarchaeota archaeon]